MKDNQILATWEAIEEDEPDISTEMLIHRVATVCNVTEDQVIEAIKHISKP